MIQILFLSLLAFAGPYDDSNDKLGKIPQGEVILRHTEDCCLSGRVHKGAHLVLKKSGNKESELITEIAEDIDGESQSVTHSAVLHKEKIFFLTEYSYPNTKEFHGSIWHWDEKEKQFTNESRNLEDLHYKKIDKPTPKVAYGEARKLVETDRVENAWEYVADARREYFWDALRTTNVEFQEGSGHPAQMEFLKHVKDVALEKIKAGKKDEAGNLLCRAWDLPDLASYVDGTEMSDACGIAGIKISDEDQESPKEGFIVNEREWKTPLRCLIRWNKFTMAKTGASVSTLNDLGYALDEAGYPLSAIKVLDEVIRVSPQRAVAHLNLADAYGHVGETQKAEKHFKNYVKLLGSKKNSVVAERTAWTATEKKSCDAVSDSLLSFRKAVDGKKPEAQVEKLLKEYLSAGGSADAIVKNNSSYKGSSSIPYVLADNGYFALARQYIKKGLPWDHEDAVDKILTDKKTRPLMLKDLEGFGMKDYEQKKEQAKAERKMRTEAPKGTEPDTELSLIKNLPEPLKKKVVKAMGIEKEIPK